ncbi:TolC family protein [Elizabethkingia meningoseptica]|uniref:TolC family protein n=1 Tax=Elizabethkingia meningoseptica TaxID=238 RepID=UPI000936D6C7|nr:TolC family protein [Elizabethkingia meningoseptica]MDE5436357.1 TolC family protein [Elizabethkingia meningoseptica]MDE5467405.1 TolC family protein [Elizabethkingia meningoseptica]MDE5473365.1 TolC family protein [Elizabethkingia meningoseptica]MDE5476798.1 TolC family protein [Elizabethkingia meningoseptica]MDE5484724.1 TolC family protein [Elizabethkingia meningoseptica]
MKINLTLAFMLGTFFPAFAHTQVLKNDTLYLSLKQAWQKAEENSRHIQMNQMETDISAIRVKDAKLERIPEVQVKGSVEKASNIPVYENGIFSRPSQHEVIHTLYKVGADFYLNIYNGNKLNLKIKQEEVLQKIKQIQKDQTISDIHYKTASLYLDLQKSLIFRKLIKEDIADQKLQLKEIKALYKNGVVLKSDVLRVELDLSKREMTLITIENDILIAMQKLNIILGIPDGNTVIPEELNTEEYKNLSYDDCLRLALEHSFDYHLSEQQTELSRLHLKDVQANVRPKLGMYGEFYYANPQIFLYPYNPNWYSLGIVGLRASFSLSSLYHNAQKVKAAKLEFEKEEVQHKNTEDEIRQRVKEAYLRYLEALEQIKLAERNVTQAKENARIIKNTYFNQASLVTDLLDANIQLLQTLFELESSKIIAQNKYYLLQNVTGTL